VNRLIAVVPAAIVLIVAIAVFGAGGAIVAIGVLG
jgi:hypothetical protein